MPKPASPPSLANTPIDASAVLAWYDRNGRALPWRVPPVLRAAGVQPDPYFVWLSEVMLQQTTIATVGRYFARFIELWPSVRDLAAAPLEQVLIEWAGLGYYARARNLHACARAVVDRFDGRFPQDSATLLTLPGVGDYTAAAIAAITADERVPVLDGNVDRLLARYLALPVPPRDAKPHLRLLLGKAVPERAGDFAQAMMDLGATICAPRRVMCLVCPLQPRCLGTRTADPLSFPVKAAKAERPVRYGHAYVLRRPDGSVLLVQRPEKGLLGGMTGTPTSDWLPAPADPGFPASAGWSKAGRVVHVFTHFQLELDVWTASKTGETGIRGRWVAPAELDNQALPTLFRKVLAAADTLPSPQKKNRRSGTGGASA